VAKAKGVVFKVSKTQNLIKVRDSERVDDEG
jgi:hypothetical protein